MTSYWLSISQLNVYWTNVGYLVCVLVICIVGCHFLLDNLFLYLDNNALYVELGWIGGENWNVLEVLHDLPHCLCNCLC